MGVALQIAPSTVLNNAGDYNRLDDGDDLDDRFPHQGRLPSCLGIHCRYVNRHRVVGFLNLMLCLILVLSSYV
jgi:hypothetical protein